MSYIKLKPGKVYLDQRRDTPKLIALGMVVSDVPGPSFRGAGFKLEVGKSYRTRDGTMVVKIVGRDDPQGPLYRASHPYLGDDDEAYTEGGQFNGVHCLEPCSAFDLVEEVK